MPSSVEQTDHWLIDDDVPVAELARWQGVRPVVSLDELARPELWESQQEFEDFLADLYARRSAASLIAVAASAVSGSCRVTIGNAVSPSRTATR